MKPLQQRAAVFLVALSLAACSSGNDKTAKPDAGDETEPDAPVEVDEPDAEVSTEPDAQADAGSPASDPVPLTVWVDDLVDHHTTDDAIPDTVDDKVITDDTDQASFDKYLPK
jgi:hypothetical protein